MASPAFKVIELNTTELLKGKNPIPVIDRDLDPGNQLTQRVVLLEVLLASLRDKRGGTCNPETYLRDLVSSFGREFRDPQSVAAAISVRNSLNHVRSKPVSTQDKTRAAQTLAEAIEDILPKVAPELRAAVLRDPHDPGESETLAQIRSRSLDEPTRMRELARRLDALLAICDARERRPAYDLAPGQITPSLAQRVRASSSRFTPAETGSLINAASTVADVAGYSEQKLRHMEKKLQTLNRGLETAVQKLEFDLGLTPKLELVTPDTNEVQEEVAASSRIENADQVPQQPCATAAASDPASDSPPPETAAEASPEAPLQEPPQPGVSGSSPKAAPAPFQVRIRLTAPAVRAVRRFGVIAACGILAAGLCCFLGRAGEPVPNSRQHSSGAPSLIVWTSPSMTPEARRADVRGILRLRISLNRSGAPVRIEVRNRLGYGLEAMAVAAVRQWRFTPALGAEMAPFEVTVEFDPAMEP